MTKNETPGTSSANASGDDTAGDTRWPVPIETVIVPRTRDLGDGFTVRRALPHTHRRLIGPFVFFDQMGPTVLRPGQGLDVRPHPHINLATVTYLFDGEILHRDSLGSVQVIQPGDVNWMTAGRGITHSERTPSSMRNGGAGVFGIQCWVALPRAHEETDPAFVHHGVDALPTMEGDGVRLRVIAGSLFDRTSPVRTFSDMFYVDVQLRTNARIEVPAQHEERAFYVASGVVRVGETTFEEGRLVILAPREKALLTADVDARLLLLGGEPMDGPRHIYWNFVSSSTDRIEQAKRDWKEGRFPGVPGETEFIPLPEDPPVVRYP